MGPLPDLLVAPLAGCGHFALTVWLFNRLHALPWRRTTIKAGEKILAGWFLIGLACAAAWLLAQGRLLPFPGPGSFLAAAWSAYLALCVCCALLALPLWVWPKLTERPCAALASNHTRCLDLAAALGGSPARSLRARLGAALPGNEIFRLHTHVKELRIPRLPAALDGLKIAHLSDLHMTGDLDRGFYDAIVDETNALGADLVLLAGDILEKDRCLPWIAPTLGRLQAPLGAHYVLGNHETRLKDAGLLRAALDEAGLIPAAGRCQALKASGGELLLAGNELPWFGPAPQVPPREEHVLRLLLAHTPDLFFWAQQQDFDLMLAGHTHGGQIRLPLIGALIAPSWHGFRYASGVFQQGPTVMHVSRGLCGVHPVRFNCPPELALVVLRQGETTT